MARKTDIRLRRSNTANAIPTSGNLSDGELAMNTADGALYFKKSDNTIITAHDNTIMHIDSDADNSGANPKVGILTTSPDKTLDVAGDIRSIDGSSNQHQLRATQVISYGTDAILNAQSTGDDVRLHTQGSLVLIAKDDGKVGIGTDAPQTMLQVVGSGNSAGSVGGTIGIRQKGDTEHDGITITSSHGNSGRIYKDSSGNLHLYNTGGNPNDFVITNAGLVGLGTASPTYPLEVTGNVSINTNSGNKGLRIITAADSEAYVIFGDGSDNSMGSIVYNNASNYLSISANNAERMRILNSGHVGINTTSPNGRLSVHDDSDGNSPNATNTNLYLQDDNALAINNGGSIVFSGIYTSGGSHLGYGPYIKAYKTNATDNNYSFGLKFATRQNGVSAQVVGINITHDQKVGIGANVTPNETLHVSGGNIRMSHATPILKLQDTSGTAAAQNASPYISFRDENDAVLGNIGYTSTSNNHLTLYNGQSAPITMFTSGTERLRILSDGNTVFGGTSVGAAGAMSVKVDGTYTDLYLYGAGTSQGGRIFFGDSSDRSAIIGTYGTGGGGKLTFKTDTTGGTSQDRLVIDSDGSIRFNNAFTFPTSIGSAGQVLKVPSSGSVLIWANESGGGGATDSIADADDDTKIQVEESADEDIIRFDVAGSEKMVLNANGLGIGAAASYNLDVNSGTSAVSYSRFKGTHASLMIDRSSTSYDANILFLTGGTTKWRLWNDGSDNTLQIRDEVNAANVMTWEAGGDVGIGTAAPNRKLHVSGSGATVGVKIEATDGSQTSVDLTNTEGAVRLINDGGSFFIYDDTDSAERLRINTSGNVGIGTSSPATLLEVAEDTSGTTPSIRVTNDSSDSLTMGVVRSAAGTAPDTAFIQYDNSLRFIGGTGTTNERMRITEAGAVGIGTVTPTANTVHLFDRTLRLQKSASDRKLEFIDNRSGANHYTIEHDTSSLYFWNATTSEASIKIRNSGDVVMDAGNVSIGAGNSPAAKLHIVNNSTGDTLLLTSTEDSSSAAPVLTFKRNSGSVADADYLGQLKFKGENDADQEIVYAKITAKIQDASDGTEDGLIEFANKKAGSNVITARLRSDSLQLLNGTGLTVAGDATISGNLTVDGTTTTINTANLNVEDKNITLNYGSGDTSASANGAGITIQDAVNSSTDATILWDGANDEFDFSHAINSAGILKVSSYDTELASGHLRFKFNGGAYIDNNTTGQSLNFRVSNSSSLDTTALTINSTGQLLATPLGVSTPSFAFTNDTNTGMTRPTSDQLQLVTAGTERIRIDDSGNVGIGISSPPDILTITGDAKYIASYDGSRYAFKLGADSDGDGNFMLHDGLNGSVKVKLYAEANAANYINNGGNFGLGTTSPVRKLHVYQPSGTNVVAEFESSDAQVWIDLQDSNSSSYGGSSYGCLIGHDPAADHLFMIADGNVSRKFVIDNNGLVGIGVTDPKSKFQVEEYGVNTTETSTSATTQVNIHTFPIADFRSARFTIQVTNSTDSTYHTSEILLVHDGTTAYITEFGEIHTGTAEEATFDADISSGLCRLRATPASTDAMEFKVVCHSVTV